MELQSLGERSSIMEMEDMTSATQLIDINYAYENNILSTSLPSILGASLRATYLKRSSSPDHMHCEVHAAIEALHYCRDCDQRLCSPCIALDHNEHDVITRDGAIDEKFDNLAGSIAQFSEMLTSLDEVIEKTEHLRNKVMEEKGRVQDSIEATFEAMHKQLDQLKAGVLEDLDATCQKYSDQCDERIAGWRVRRDDLRPLENLEDETKQRLLDDGTDLFDLENTVRTQLIEAKALLPSLLTPNSMRLNLRWNERFRTALSHKTLGGGPAIIEDEECAFEPFKKQFEFSARHVNDKSASCIEALTEVPGADPPLLALVDSANVKVKMFTHRGRAVRCFVGGGRYRLNHPSDIVAMKSGDRLAVTDPGGNKVVVFSERGVGMDHFGVSSCDGLANLPNVDEPETSNIQSVCVLNAEGKKLERLDVLGAGDSVRIRKQHVDVPLQHMGLMTKGRYLVVNSINGCVFVSDPYEHCLLVFSPEGAFMKKYGRLGNGLGELNTPASLACDRRGQVLVADFFNHRVHLLDQCGNFIRFVLTAANAIRLPQAIHLDQNDAHLWVAQRDGMVKQFAYS